MTHLFNLRPGCGPALGSLRSPRTGPHPDLQKERYTSATAPFNFCNPDTVNDRHLINDGEFLISWSGTPGTSFGAFIWQRGRAALNQHIFKCLPKTKLYADRFLQMAINGRLDEMIAKAHGGVGLQHITKGNLEALVLPVPPLAEQHRIVAKVDELMALCDRLETTQTEREARRDRLVSASLARVTEPASQAPSSARTSAQFHLDHFARLTTRPEHVKQLRQTILNLAVRGRLVPRDSAESNSTIPISIGNLIQGPFAVPAPWRWIRFGEIHQLVRGVTYTKSDVGEAADGKHVAVLRANNIGTGINLDELVYVNRRCVSEHHMLRQGDFLIALSSGSKNLVGKAAAVEQPVNAAFGGFCGAIRLIYDDLHPFVRLFLSCPLYRQTIAAGSRGIGINNLKRSTLDAVPFPLPPLAEQRRIVAKVDELMTLCDQLEASLASDASNRARLLEVLLHEALEPTA